MPEKIPITIIGAGVIGCAIAYQLSKKHQEILVIEKNPKVTAENQSSRNSGVIHAGIYYPQDVSPLKAKLCVTGNRMLYDFCEEFTVPFARTGKLVLAVEEWELPYLKDTFQIALQNHVHGAQLISAGEAKKLEPNIECLQAAYFPTSGIVEPTQLVYRLFTLATRNEALFLFNTKVVDVRTKGKICAITTESAGRSESFESEMVINCAGLYADEIAKKINPACPFEILPIRGEAAKFYKNKRASLAHHGLNIYPVPHPIGSNGKKANLPFDQFQQLFLQDKILKTVGVHLTPTFEVRDGAYFVGDTVTIGPATKKVASREDNAINLFSADYYYDRVHSFFPNLKVADITLHQAGVQAKLAQQFDWVIQPDDRYPKCIQLIGIDSPGLTSCLAIAEYVEELIKEI